MPRFIGMTKLTTAEKVDRAKRYRVSGYKGWVDPFPSVGGTLPEKMVYAALSFRGIPFWTQNEVNFAIPEIGFNKDYRPDFVLPTLRIIIEVQGSFWHSKPKTIEDDAFKFAIYEQTGWRVLAWWDYDIVENVNKLFAADPVLRPYGVKQSQSSETSNGRKVNRNDSKGIQTLNKKRGERLLYRQKTAKVKSRKAKTFGTYTTYGK